MIWAIKNYYSCQFCHKEFESEGEQKIILGVSPLCSYKCKFNVIYNILKFYSPLQIKVLQDFFHTKDNSIFELTKKMIKEVLVQEVQKSILD